MSNNIHKHHRQRLKKQFDESGGKGMSDITLLEMMLFFAVPQGDTNPLAHRLIERFGGFDKVLEAGKEELMDVKGVGEHVATYLTTFMPVLQRYNEKKCDAIFVYDDKEMLKSFIRAKYFGINTEKAMLILFNTAGQYINYNWVGDGDFNSVQFDNRRMATAVIENKAPLAVLVHNHPSGICNPSSTDLEATKTVAKFLKSIGVILIDSIIVTHDDIRLFTEVKSFAKHLNP